MREIWAQAGYDGIARLCGLSKAPWVIGGSPSDGSVRRGRRADPDLQSRRRRCRLAVLAGAVSRDLHVVFAHAAKPPITVIIGGRALLMLIAARFSGSGSGKDLLSRAISLIASDLLPFSSFPTPVAPDSYRGRDRPACRIPVLEEGWPTGCGRSEIRYS